MGIKIEKDISCHFCGKKRKEVSHIIASEIHRDLYICSECIFTAYEIIKEMGTASEIFNKEEGYLKPVDIKKKLDEYVIKQDKAKKALAVAVYNHYKRLTADKYDYDDVEVEKSNILFVGPTGCGKTYLAKTLAKIIDVPFVSADATSLTEAGYVGEDVENIITKLVQKADNDISRAESGIVYIDEIDKISRSSNNKSISRDVSGEGVQQALLKMLEGDSITVTEKRAGNRTKATREIDTSKILFIVGGAFGGIEDYIKERMNYKGDGKSQLGFIKNRPTEENLEDKEWLMDLKREDLLEYGMMPEFLGRLPIVVPLESLDKTALKTILTEPKNSIVKQYVKLFNLDDIELEFEEEALNSIAEKAIDLKAGARGLRSTIEDVMLDIMYSIPSKEDVEKCIITKEVVEDKEEPRLILKEKKKAEQ